MKRTFLALLATLACHLPAASLAATAQASPATPPPPAPAAAPAAEAPLDPMALAAARDLLDAMRFKFTLAADMKAASRGAEPMLRQLVNQKLSANPAMDAATRTRVLAAVEKTMPAAVEALEEVFNDPQTSEEITKETMRIYARSFTVDELVQTANFYRTPTGSKMLAMAGRINAQTLDFGRRYIAPRTDKLIEHMLTTASQPAKPSKD